MDCGGLEFLSITVYASLRTDEVKNNVLPKLRNGKC